MQTLGVAVRPGDVLEIVWWHDNLLADEPAEGVFSLHLDGAEVYARSRAIPGPPQITTESFEAEVGGDELVLRVDNHGANTWNLLRLTRL